MIQSKRLCDNCKSEITPPALFFSLTLRANRQATYDDFLEYATKQTGKDLNMELPRVIPFEPGGFGEFCSRGCITNWTHGYLEQMDKVIQASDQRKTEKTPWRSELGL